MKDLKVQAALQALLPRGAAIKMDTAQFTMNVTMPKGSSEQEIDNAGKKIKNYLVENDLDRKVDKINMFCI